MSTGYRPAAAAGKTTLSVRFCILEDKKKKRKTKIQNEDAVKSKQISKVSASEIIPSASEMENKKRNAATCREPAALAGLT